MRVSLICRPSPDPTNLTVIPTTLEPDDLVLLYRMCGSKVLVNQTEISSSYGRRQMQALCHDQLVNLVHIANPLVFCTILMGVRKKDPNRDKWNEIVTHIKFMENCQWWVRVLSANHLEEQKEESVLMNMEGQLEMSDLTVPFQTEEQLELLLGNQQFPTDSEAIIIDDELELLSDAELGLEPILGVDDEEEILLEEEAPVIRQFDSDDIALSELLCAIFEDEEEIANLVLGLGN